MWKRSRIETIMTEHVVKNLPLDNKPLENYFEGSSLWFQNYTKYTILWILRKYMISTILFWLRERSRNGTIVIKHVAKNLPLDNKPLKI